MENENNLLEYLQNIDQGRRNVFDLDSVSLSDRIWPVSEDWYDSPHIINPSNYNIRLGDIGYGSINANYVKFPTNNNSYEFSQNRNGHIAAKLTIHSHNEYLPGDVLKISYKSREWEIKLEAEDMEITPPGIPF